MIVVRLVLLALITLVGAALLASAGDIKRYLQMRQM